MSRKQTPRTTMGIEAMSNAAAAVETIATNNSLMLEAHYNTSASDVLALVQLARAHWYELNSKGKS